MARFTLLRIENGPNTKKPIGFNVSGSEFVLQIIGDLSVSMVRHQRMLKG